MIYSYNKHINGFSALLEEEEAADIASEHSLIVTRKQKIDLMTKIIFETKTKNFSNYPITNYYSKIINNKLYFSAQIYITNLISFSKLSLTSFN